MERRREGGKEGMKEQRKEGMKERRNEGRVISLKKAI